MRRCSILPRPRGAAIGRYLLFFLELFPETAWGAAPRSAGGNWAPLSSRRRRSKREKRFGSTARTGSSAASRSCLPSPKQSVPISKRAQSILARPRHRRAPAHQPRRQAPTGDSGCRRSAGASRGQMKVGRTKAANEQQAPPQAERSVRRINTRSPECRRLFALAIFTTGSAAAAAKEIGAS